MARQILVLVALVSCASALRDVPLGECHQCEVACFSDCTLKYSNEIMQDDNFLQVSNQTASVEAGNRTEELDDKFTQCLKEDNCPCGPQSQAAKGKAIQLVAGGKKKKTQCAAGAAPCSAKCAAKVADQDIAKLSEQSKTAKNSSFLQKGFPVRSVKINAFAKGKMTLDHCFKYCLAATCGCSDAPVDIAKATKQNAQVKGVIDTKPSKQYRPAKQAECAKGMPGKKVAKGLYIKLGGGVSGYSEVCSKDFISKVVGSAGDPAAVAKKCKSGASEDAKYGCLWDNQKGVCHVGFSPILRCLTAYTDDKSL